MQAVEVNWPSVQVVRGDPGAESDLKQYLLRAGEAGRGIDLPEHRQLEIEEEAKKRGMTKCQAMSLRRQHMKRLEYQRRGCMVSVDEMNLGSEAGQVEHARAIEDRVASALDRIGVAYTRNSPPVPGPDFTLHGAVRINGSPANWIEVKTFYGCGSLTSKKFGVGRVPGIAQRYQSAHGPGCIALGHGFHECFAARVAASAPDVLVVDASDETLELVAARHSRQATQSALG